ncbi:MAG: hypothetical protein ACPGWR_04595 [Ardenticatenaceae bacterium]
MLKKEVDALFCRLTAGKLSVKGPRLESGWEMCLPAGQVVYRSTLQAEARPLIAQGKEAVPYLFGWVMNENLALRYVALYALQQITGKKPYVSYFKKGTEECSQAIEVWREWLQNQNRTLRQNEALRKRTVWSQHLTFHP